MRRTALHLIVIAGALALAACADATAPQTKQAAKLSGNHTSSSRYMLASGATPPPGCSDAGNGYWICDIDQQ